MIVLIFVIIILVLVGWFYWKNNRKLVESEGYKEFEADEKEAKEYMVSHGHTNYVRKKGTNLYAVTTGEEKYVYDPLWSSYTN